MVKLALGCKFARGCLHIELVKQKKKELENNEQNKRMYVCAQRRGRRARERERESKIKQHTGQSGSPGRSGRDSSAGTGTCGVYTNSYIQLLIAMREEGK